MHLHKSLLFSLLLFIFSTTVCANEYTPFERWVRLRSEELTNSGETHESGTAGIQYVWKGNRLDPVILSLHGAYGGWDQSLLIASNFIEEGFSVLAISRPGYLGSSFGEILPPGITPEAQADTIVSLLDSLGISSVAALGFSAGAPVAYLLAQRHPERVWALVLESIGATIPQDIPLYTSLQAITTLNNPSIVDFQGYMTTLAVQDSLESIAKEVFSYDSNLNIAQLNQRIRYVKSHREQAKFLKQFLLAATPISLRVLGGRNDIENMGQFSSFSYTGFKTPTRIVQAINDSNGDNKTAEFVYQQIKSESGGLCRLIKVQDSGHFIWLGKETKDWEKRITSFLHTYARSSKLIQT